LIKLHRIFYLKKYIYILALEMASEREPALCQLYRHTFVPYWAAGGQDSLEPTALPRPSRNWLSGIIEIVAKEERKDGGD